MKILALLPIALLLAGCETKDEEAARLKGYQYKAREQTQGKLPVGCELTVIKVLDDIAYFVYCDGRQTQSTTRVFNRQSGKISIRVRIPTFVVEPESDV